MAQVKAEQVAFSAGEVAPELLGRVDVARYQTALRRARNVIGLRQGGVRSRPGTHWVGQIRNVGRRAKLIPFQFSADQGYALEFGHQRLRVILDGAYVTREPLNVVSVTGTNPVTVELSGAHGITGGPFTTNSPQVYFSGLGGLADGDGLSKVNGRTFMLADTPTSTTITLRNLDATMFNATGLTAYTSGGTAAFLYELATPYDMDLNEPFELTYEQSADVMYLAHPKHQLRKLSRTGHAAWSLDEVEFGTEMEPPTNVAAAASTPGGTGTPTVQSYKVSSYNDLTGQESLVSGAQTCNNDLTLAGNYNTVTWDPPGSGPTPMRYFVYKESNGLYGFIGATEAETFKDQFIDPDLGDTPPVTFNPFTDPVDPMDPDELRNYPAAVGFFEQRLFLAGAESKPNGVWASRSGDFENLNFSRPVKADDGIAFGVSARQLNQVRHLVPLGSLLACTSDAIFEIKGGGVTDYITPTSIVVRPNIHRGSSKVRPLLMDEAVLLITAKGQRPYSISYSLEADGYKGADASVLAPHLFKERSIIDMAWCEFPHSAAFLTRDDGKLLCMTWMPDQEVLGWTMLELGLEDNEGMGGSGVESVCAVTEDGRDRIYLVVKREINGQNRRYVERLADPFEVSDKMTDQQKRNARKAAVYLDAASVYDGAAADVIGGLEYLEGVEVTALADGVVVDGLTVTNGKITLGSEAEVVVVGVPYSAYIHTLTPVLQRPTQGRSQSVPRTRVRLSESGVPKVGTSRERLETPKLDPLYWNDDSKLYTGDLTVSFDTPWRSDIGLYVQMDDPLPMTVLGLFDDLGIGG
jgi:hypothetical protein